MPHPNSRRGSVLLSVLVILMLSGVMVIGIQRQQTRNIEYTQQFVRSVQAWHYALGAEAYARQVLYEAYDPKVLIDYAGQGWGKPKPAFALTQGSMVILIQDLQGRFNLNSLAQQDQKPTALFFQLLAQTDMPSEQAQMLVAALKNMATVNNAFLTIAAPPSARPEQDGAIACTGTPFLADASQLMDLGMSAEDYRTLAPYLTALPTTCLNININAVSGLLERVIADNSTKLESLEALKKQPGYLTAGDVSRLGLGSGIGVSSNYFAVLTSIKDDVGVYGLASVIKRSVDKNNRLIVNTVARNWQRCSECYTK
jgi:general secretion pathway protein K